MRYEQQEEAVKLSRTEEACEEGDILDLVALACPPRVPGLDLSAARYRLMEPVVDG